MGFKYQSNEVDFRMYTGNYSFVSGGYTIQDHCVSVHQDPQNHIYNGLYTALTAVTGAMTYSVGRHKTQAVGDWFKSKINGSQNTYGDCFETLNFAFIGRLEFILTGDCVGVNKVPCYFDNIVIAQGNKSTRNLWFFGGTQCRYEGGQTVTCQGIAHYGFIITLTVLWIRPNIFHVTQVKFEDDPDDVVRGIP